MRDGAEETVYSADDVADDFADEAGDVVDGVDEQRVEVEGFEDTADDVDEVA